MARLEIFAPAASDAEFLMEFESPRAPGILDRHFALPDALTSVMDGQVDLISAPPDSKRLLASINECREAIHEA